MAFEVEKDYELALASIKKTCRVVYVVLWLLLILSMTFFLAAIVLCSLSLLLPHTVPFIYHIDLLSLSSLVAFAIITFFILRNALLVLKDVLSNESPFTIKQAKRIRNVSYLLFGKVLLDLLVPTQVVPMSTEDFSVSFEMIHSTDFLININIEVLIVALLFFCVSLIFRYGVLLQKDARGFF